MNKQRRKSLKALDVARYFLYLAKQENKPVTNKKLQKLVYYAQAWALVLTDKKLFNEPIEAWVHGPTVRSLYVRYKNFGFNPIQEEITLDSINVPTEIKKLLDRVWQVYGKFDAGYLEMLTHFEEPWREAREELQVNQKSENQISLKTMKSFYLKKLEQSKKSK